MTLPDTLKCIIVDDEQLARTLISGYITRVPHLEEVGSFKSPLDAMVFIRSNRVDVIFLDIQMPELSGLEMLRTLQFPPKVIVVSAYQEYAIEGFELDVTDYLLKPVSFGRFLKAVNKLDGNAGIKKQDTGARFEKVIVLKANNKTYRVKLSDIMFIEGMKEYLRFHLVDKRLTVLKSFKELETELNDAFVRVHKSYIISINYISALNGNQLEVGAHKLPIGATYKAEVMNKAFK